MFWIILSLITVYCLICYVIGFSIATYIHIFFEHKIHDIDCGSYGICKICGKFDSRYHNQDLQMWVIMSPLSIPLFTGLYSINYIYVLISYQGPKKFAQYIRTQLGLPND